MVVEPHILIEGKKYVPFEYAQAISARLAEALQANTELNAECMKESARTDDAEARLAEAEQHRKMEVSAAYGMAIRKQKRIEALTEQLTACVGLLKVMPSDGLSAYDVDKWKRRRAGLLALWDIAPTGAGGNVSAFVCCEGIGAHAQGCTADSASVPSGQHCPDDPKGHVFNKFGNCVDCGWPGAAPTVSEVPK